MIHRIVLRVGSQEALDFWGIRLGAGTRPTGSLVFADPDGLELELRAVQTPDEPLIAVHPEVPRELAIQGLEEVRAYASNPGASRAFLEGALGFASRGAAA